MRDLTIEEMLGLLLHDRISDVLASHGSADADAIAAIMHASFDKVRSGKYVLLIDCRRLSAAFPAHECVAEVACMLMPVERL